MKKKYIYIYGITKGTSNPSFSTALAASWRRNRICLWYLHDFGNGTSVNTLWAFCEHFETRHCHFNNICKTLECEPLIFDGSAFIDDLGLVEGLFRVGFLVGFGLGFVYGLFENCLKAISGSI